MNFKEIYNEHINRVFNLTLHYVQNFEDAEEITQDVFVKIHEAQSNFQFQSQLSTWIYRITVNTCLDFLKSKKRKKRFAYIKNLFNGNNEIIYDQIQFDHPGVKLEHKEQMHQLFKLINELPLNQKTVIILHKIEHIPQNEIAEIMHLSPKALESLVQRAKTNLQNKLNNTKEIS